MLARPRAWLALLAILSLPFGFALPRLELRTEGSALYPVGSAVIEATNRDRLRFRDPEALIVLVCARPGGEAVLTPAGLEYVRQLTDRMRAVAGVRPEEVRSLATVLDVTTSAERIRLTRFLDPPPRTPGEVQDLVRRLERAEIPPGFLFGADGRSAAIFVPLAENATASETIRRAHAALMSAPNPSFPVRLTGPVVAEALLGDQILADLVHLVPLVVGVVALALFACVGSAAGAVIPLLAMLFVLLWTFGAMAMLGVPLTIVTSVLPVLLMAMAITDQIHLLERFQIGIANQLDRRAALAQALAEVGPPIVRTSVTTALGFLSFTATSVVPMRQFGLFASLGMACAMAVTFTLVPAALMVVPKAWLASARHRREREVRGLEAWVGTHPRAALFGALGFLTVSLAGLPGVRVQDSWVRNFDSGSDLVVAEGIFNREYRGSYRLDVTLDSDRDGTFKTPAGLALVDSVERELASLPEVAGTRSVAPFVRAGLRGVDPGRSALSLDEPGLAQLFLLLDMSGSGPDVERVLTPSGRAARIECFVRGADYRKATPLLDRVERLGRAVAAAHPGVRVSSTGDLPVATEVVRATVQNQIQSVAVTILALGFYLAFSFRSVALAAVLLLPVVSTTLIVFGGMGAFGIPLGVATGMFAALAEGEGIDFSIHIASRYLDVRRGRPDREALREALASAGTAMRWNGVALVGGCLVLCLSALRPVRALGGLLAAGMAVSYLMALLFLPALLLSLRPGAARTSGGGGGAS